MNGYEGGRYLYYRKYSVQSACVCLLLPKVGGSRSSLVFLEGKTTTLLGVGGP